MHHFDGGEKVFLNEKFVNLTPANIKKRSTIEFNVYRLIKPMDYHDVDSLYSYDEYTKNEVKQKINPALPAYLVKTDNLTSSLFEDYYLGTAIKHEVQLLKVGDQLIENNVQVVAFKDYISSDITLPNGYMYANNYYYILSSTVGKQFLFTTKSSR